MLTSLRNFLRAAFRHDALNREMNDEMRAHLERATERLMARGLSRRDAEAEARREFGNVAVHSEEGRDARGASWVETVRADIRYGWRSLRHSPAFALVAAASLAIGIGANTAIFSLINAVMLKPLPVVRPSELLLVSLRDSLPRNPSSLGMFELTNPMWERLRDETKPWATYAVSTSEGFSLVSGGELRSARGMYINGDFFNTLGVRPLSGRLISPADDYPGCPATVALGEAFWRSELGGAADAIGRTIPLEGKPFTIVGIVPSSFFGVDVGMVQQLYVPLCAEAVIRGEGSALPNKSNWWLRIMARPKSSITAAAFAERLSNVSRPILATQVASHWNAERRAEFTASRFTVSPAFHGMSEVRTRYATALKVLMGMVGLILLIACANVANLSLARGAARSREIAVRIAVGASRARVMRQLLTEATLVAVAGTLAGVVVAVWATRFLVGLLGTSRGQIALDLSPDLPVLVFAIGACITTVLLFALVPAWRATRIDPQIAMKSGGRGMAEGHNRFRIGKALVVAQTALAFVLVVGAGLLVTTFVRLTTFPMNFEAGGVLVARVRLGGTSIPATQRRAVIDRMRAQLEAIPGVESVSSIDITPLSGNAWNDEVVVDGDPVTALEPVLPWFNQAGAGYFKTMRTRLIAGRDFGPQDTPTSPKVAIINEAAGQVLFKGAPPIGRTYHTRFQGRDGERTTIIGVVQNSPYRSLREETPPVIYTTNLQAAEVGGAQFVIRAGDKIPAVMSAFTASAKATDPRILLMFTRLDEQVSQSLQRERALAMLSGFFGVLALLLATMGLYGVLAYTLARRRVEIGIRIALGAGRAGVMRLVLSDVALLVGLGIAIGGSIAYAGSTVLASLLYGVVARDMVTMAGSALLLAAVAFIAGAIPARRAASLQPTAALRED